ncbi:Ovule protein [Caenorhabditis elegans]|uniref:Ovule protein n=1 Tax=Caenorhabditis elegans TaxID=6239 RepID=A0A2C9C338_CAEEL|nr:Ovule protein [Caenorhabditis elegans]SOF58786.1 Ovule protein [Caenorhabditis elegans]|eukprot:NP_001343792.1 Uncharacterized protein CELE_EGAP1.5 [Caenorhabditis elegans]
MDVKSDGTYFLRVFDCTVVLKEIRLVKRRAQLTDDLPHQDVHISVFPSFVLFFHQVHPFLLIQPFFACFSMRLIMIRSLTDYLHLSSSHIFEGIWSETF